MITILLEQIIELIKGWISAFSDHAQHVEDKLDSIDSTASDIKDNTDSLPDIEDNTAAVITPINNIKTNTGSIASSNTAIANNTTAISNQVSAMSTNVGRAAAYAEDCANNSLNILDKVTTIASDTTQIRTDTGNMSLEQSKIYDAVKWLLADKTTTENVIGSFLTFETDMTEALNNCILKFNSDNGFTSATVTRCGVNLFDESQLLQATGWAKNSDGYYYGTRNNYNVAFGTGFAIQPKYKENTRYTFKFTAYCSTNESMTYIRFYYKDGTSTNINITGTTPTEYIGTSAANKTINYIAGSFGSNGSVVTYFKDIMLVEGTAATDYIPYLSNFVTIPFGNIYYAGILDIVNGIGLLSDTPNTEPTISISFTPGVVNTLKGLNNIFANIESELNIIYTESVKFYLDKQDNA